MLDLDWMFDNQEDGNPADSDLSWMFADHPASEIPVLGGNIDAPPDYETTRNLPSPIKLARREAKQRLIADFKKQSLMTLIPELPEPGETIYFLTNGSGAEQKRVPGGIARNAVDLGTFVPHLVKLLGDQGCSALISTWTMNVVHIRSYLSLLDGGQLSELTVITGKYFKRREPALAHLLITELEKRGQRYLAANNHTKIICIRNPAGRCVTVTSSANLSSQPRIEQGTLTTDPGVYEWFKREFFDYLLAQEP